MTTMTQRAIDTRRRMLERFCATSTDYDPVSLLAHWAHDPFKVRMINALAQSMADWEERAAKPVTIFYADATIRDARGHTIARRNQVITPDVHQRVSTMHPDVQPYGYTVFTDANDARAHIRADNGAFILEV